MVKGVEMPDTASRDYKGCSCHAGCMGHRFECDTLECGFLGCGVSWHQHQRDPQPCAGLRHRIRGELREPDDG